MDRLAGSGWNIAVTLLEKKGEQDSVIKMTRQAPHSKFVLVSIVALVLYRYAEVTAFQENYLRRIV